MMTIQEEWQVKPPTLSDLKERHVNQRELQAALVALIELVNISVTKHNKLCMLVESKENKVWRADI